MLWRTNGLKSKAPHDAQSETITSVRTVSRKDDAL
jgi:hypothetical protein